MEIKKIILFIVNNFLMILIISLNSCKDYIIDVPIIKSPHEYAWSSDTLHLERNFQTLMSSMWGSSPKDIYTVGHTTSSKGVIWHYDGIKWENIKLNFVEGGPIKGPFNLSSVLGHSLNQIWAVGGYLRDNPNPPPEKSDSSLIICYDGTQWKPVDNLGGDRLFNLSGINSNDLWTGGWSGTMFHYNGVVWEKDSVGFDVDTMSLAENKQFMIDGVCSDGINTFALGTYYNQNLPQNIYYFFRKYNSWVVADSFIFNYTYQENVRWGPYLHMTKNGVMYSYGMGGVFLWNGNSWQRIFTHNNIWNIFVKDNGHIFVLIASGQVYYYNGNSWNPITALNNPDLYYTCAWADENEAFIAGITTGGFPQKTIILHGK